MRSAQANKAIVRCLDAARKALEDAESLYLKQEPALIDELYRSLSQKLDSRLSQSRSECRSALIVPSSQERVSSSLPERCSAQERGPDAPCNALQDPE